MGNSNAAWHSKCTLKDSAGALASKSPTGIHPADVALVKDALCSCFQRLIDYKGLRACLREELLSSSIILVGRSLLTASEASAPAKILTLTGKCRLGNADRALISL